MKQNRNIDERHLVLCFKIHQPRRLKVLSSDSEWLDGATDRDIMERVARDCYLPTNSLLLRLIERYPQIRVAFSISGSAIEQMESYCPEVLVSFRALADTGCVDFLSETYYHSLAFLMDGEEFEIQILQHAEKIAEHFNVRPHVFRNTGLVYSDDIGRRIGMLGLQGVFTEGFTRSLQGRSPHFLYEHRDQNGLKILMRNPSLSDDIAFRVAVSAWGLTAEKFMSWLDAMPENEKLVAIGIDYETFGEHHKPESGIFQFLENLLLLLGIGNGYRMATPSEIVSRFDAASPISIPDYMAMAGCELADWVGNERQREAFAALIELESAIKSKNDPGLLRLWRCMQGSDHFYFMSERAYGTNRLSPYKSADEAFFHYMKVIEHLRERINENPAITEPEKINEAIESDRRSLHAPVWALNIDSRSGYNS